MGISCGPANQSPTVSERHCDNAKRLQIDKIDLQKKAIKKWPQYIAPLNTDKYSQCFNNGRLINLTILDMSDYNIRIKAFNEKVCFEIADIMGNPVSRSIHYHSICDLENGLRSLNLLTSGAQSSKFDRDMDLITFTSAHSRRRISLFTTFSSVEALDMLTKLPSAKIIDERQSRKLRTNLSGHLSDFN